MDDSLNCVFKHTHAHFRCKLYKTGDPNSIPWWFCLFILQMSFDACVLSGTRGEPLSGVNVASCPYWANRTDGRLMSVRCVEGGSRPGRPIAFKSLMIQHHITGRKVKHKNSPSSHLTKGLCEACSTKIVIKHHVNIELLFEYLKWSLLAGIYVGANEHSAAVERLMLFFFFFHQNTHLLFNQCD